MKQLIECVPNYSEGRDKGIIQEITDAIASVEGISLLDVDMGASTNRTVVTFVGEPAQVVEAAFRGCAKAAERIDMRTHQGAHPRMGATDVVPLIPLSGIGHEDCIAWSRRLAQRVGEELQIPVYLYELAASHPDRKNLAVIRSGEYEGFASKILLPEWKPDFGPQKFNAKSGQSVIGVRDFLIAYNVNLNTTSVRRANSVAFDVRENGRVKTEDGTPAGKVVRDENGEEVRVPGMLRAVKAIGWMVEEHGIAQVSMNLTNIGVTPLHAAFDACCTSAGNRGLRVTGSEVVGLLPLNAMLEAGRHYLRKQNVSEGVSEEELVRIAVKSMGLDELYPFHPREKIIEYRIADERAARLVKMTLRQFCNETLSESPAPGGGSVAALVGALGTSLGGMVANLSAAKQGWDSRIPEFSAVARQAQALKDQLLALVDEDTAAFNKVMDAYRLPKDSEEEKAARRIAIQSANEQAALVPLRVMEQAIQAYPLLRDMAEKGNPASITDVGVGALCIHACVQGASFNVRINLGQVPDAERKAALGGKVARILNESAMSLRETLALVESKMG
ncbi:MAG: glutamate formimidoyltransferase [Bacteroidota bacterium]|jgi:glutamate formiminotransferase/formiminotetrahydrofolate cyclodeaminase